MATVTNAQTFVSGETVTPAKLNALGLPTVVLAAGEVGTTELANSAVTNTKLASDIDASKLTTGTLPIARIADGAVTNSKVANGAVVQVVQANDGTMATVTSTIPLDNTVPTNTEGTEILSQTITPQSSTNKVLVRAVVPFTTGNANVIFSVFRGSTCIVATGVAPTTTDYMQIGVVEFLDSPATTSATTYSVRAGTGNGTTVRICGYASFGTTVFDGKYLRTLTLTEIKAS